MAAIILRKQSSMRDAKLLQEMEGMNRMAIGQLEGTVDVHGGSLPADVNIVRDITIYKQCADGEWQERRCVLTTGELLLVRKGKTSAADCVPLHEVTRVQKLENVGGAMQALVLRGKFTSMGMGSSSTNMKMEHQVEVFTDPTGYNSGRTYKFKFASEASAMDFTRFLKDLVSKARRKYGRDTALARAQQAAKDFLNHWIVQLFVTICILANFVQNALQVQYNPEEGSDLDLQFKAIDLGLVVVFTIELMLNMLAHWFWPYWTDSWQIFDFIIVSVSITTLVMVDVAPGLSTLRVLRAFRVLRVVGRFKELRNLTTALLASVIPVLNSFVIVLLVTCIYAILGTDFYGQRENGKPLFGTFTTSLWTMFQASTFDGWAGDLAYPIFNDKVPLTAADYDRMGVDPVCDDSDGYKRLPDNMVILFFISYMIIVVWTLMPVTVAVLLDNFMECVALNRRRAAIEEFKHFSSPTDPLHPLLRALTHWETNGDLSYKIQTLFSLLDVDDTGSIDFQQTLEGLKKMGFQPSIHLTEEEWDRMTDQGKLCSKDGTTNSGQFETIIRKQVKLYIQQRLSDEHLRTQGDDNKTVVIDSYKHMIILLEALMGRIESLKEKIEKTNNGNGRPNMSSNGSDGGGGGGSLPLNQKSTKADLANSSSSNLRISRESSGDDKEQDAALKFAKELKDRSSRRGKQDPAIEKAHGLLTGLIGDFGEDDERAAGAAPSALRGGFDQSQNLASQMRVAVKSEVDRTSSWRAQGTGEHTGATDVLGEGARGEAGEGGGDVKVDVVGKGEGIVGRAGQIAAAGEPDDDDVVVVVVEADIVLGVEELADRDDVHDDDECVASSIERACGLCSEQASRYYCEQCEVTLCSFCGTEHQRQTASRGHMLQMTLPDGGMIDHQGHQGKTPGASSEVAAAVGAVGTTMSGSSNPWTLDIDDLVQRSLQKKASSQEDATSQGDMLAGSGNDALATRLFHQDTSQDQVHARGLVNGSMSPSGVGGSRFSVGGGGLDTHPPTMSGGSIHGSGGDSYYSTRVGSFGKPSSTLYEGAPPPPGRVSANLRKSLWLKNETPSSSSSSSDSEVDDGSNSSGWRAASQRSTPKNRFEVGAAEAASRTTSDWTWVEPGAYRN